MPARVPPHDTAAETSVLGAILIDPDAVITAAELLDPEAFYDEKHQFIFEAMQSLFDKRSSIDAVTVANQLKKNKNLTAAGGSAYLAEITNGVTSSGHVKHYSLIVKELSTKRKLIGLSGTLHELAFDEGKEIGDIIDEAEQTIFTVAGNYAPQRFMSLKDTLAESFERLDELQKNQGGLRGVPTGFGQLDELLAGLQKSNLVILAARPGMGKTAFALNIAHYVAVAAKLKVGIFSLEMSKEELVDRLLVSQADIDAWKLKTGRLSQQDFRMLSDAMGVLADAEIFIDDTPGMSIFEIRTKARRLMIEHNVDLILVDYLQLAHGRTRDNRVQEVAEISQGLKNIARELKIPILALSQLSRAIEQRGEKAPQLSDLRESGSIEQDADVVMFLYRKDDDMREAVTLKVAKHRNGALGDVELYFKGDRIRFYGMDTKRGVDKNQTG